MAAFMFDIPEHRHMKKSHLGMAFYDGYKDDEAVTVVVHVTEHLTGNTSNICVCCLFHHQVIKHPVIGQTMIFFSSFRLHVQQCHNSVRCKIQI